MVLALFVATAITNYEGPRGKARLAADWGTLAAMRSAIGIYYGQHGSYPAHPGSHIQSRDGDWQCVNLTYSDNSATGELQITSANDVTHCR